MSSRAIYAVADAKVFLGAVATINSLRLVGHREPILLLDCGLDEEQSRLLAREAAVVRAPADTVPHLLKHVLPLAEPADVMLLVDVDIVVTRSLEPLLTLAGEGKTVAFADALFDRFYPSWGELLDLGQPRRQTYVNTGLLALSRESGVELLERLREKAAHVNPERSMTGDGSSPDYPFYFLDQDVFNAILATHPDPDNLVVLDHRLAPHPPFQGVRLRDAGALDCAYLDGVRPFVLHHIQAKPWLVPLHQTVYSQLLPRLLLAEDLPLRLPPELVPLRLREGPLASVDRHRAGVVANWRSTRGRLGRWRQSAKRRGALDD
jgi:hypothetical protein